MTIEFGKLYFASTFTDPKTQVRFVKVDETSAVYENDVDDCLASFEPEELVIV